VDSLLGGGAMRGIAVIDSQTGAAQIAVWITS
jgi:hypothetical protein